MTFSAYHMTSKARDYWRENPPNSPYTVPAIAICEYGNRSSESDLLGFNHAHPQISGDGYRFSASEYECGSNYGSISVSSDALSDKQTEKFPDFVDDGSPKTREDRLPAPNSGQQHHFPQHSPLQMVTGYPYHPNSSPGQTSTRYQAAYKFYPSVSYLPRHSLCAIKTNYLPILERGLRKNPNGGLDDSFTKSQDQITSLPPTVVSRECTEIPSSVNPNIVGVNRHFVGVASTMEQKGGDVVSPVTLATSEEHAPSSSSAPASQFPSDYNNTLQHPDTAPASAAITAITGTVATMPVADNSPHTYASNPVCYPYAMPFDNGARYSLPPSFGVIKITNIPYAVTKHEILQFLGRNARPLTPDLGCPVHIIMERSTGKTMDCYVEFPAKADADCALAWVNRGLDSFQTPKLGNRHVVVRASNQDELLKDLFPRAKNVDWKDGIPHVRAGRENYCSGFQGFLTGEEIFCTVRHAEVPQRSVYCAKCLQRPYENMMSTLHKFPWYATYHYTVEDRNQIFSATLRLIHALVPQVERGQTIGLDSRLVQELLEAGLRCPVFNDRQKFVLNVAAKNHSVVASPTERFWPFDTITRKPNATEEHVMQYAEFIVAGAATLDPGTNFLANTWHPVMHASSPFGKIWLEWGWGNTHHKWQTAVDYENSILIQLVTEGVKNKRGAESRSHSLATSGSSTSASVEAPSSAADPITKKFSQSFAHDTLRYPVRATHNMNRQASSAPINLIHIPLSTNKLSDNDDASRASPANHRRPANSFSGLADTQDMVPKNIFGAVGTRRRTRATTNGSRHSPVPEVDETCYECSV
ncbi:hypothetical protein BDBG_06939 [Blastomyces gilchristii SLH14081]|uniref:RRM domain-containing protein n=1 Tax=Blastomyces gilchristii (strain SLH14081) TaxID=559298 RepID=A0A179UTV0_BLAGS|nr:uncharacterized protein BDBG_06939 [Blastomyces gilchristii SLH14081]OAT11454.1 hypothetical protein BDBG_06939 [Blastomyces gilchristii SLH14081]